MELPPDQTASDIAQYAGLLSELRSEAVRVLEQHPEWNRNDFRRTVFVKIGAICDATGIAYLFLGRCLMSPKWWRSDNGLISIPPDTLDSDIEVHFESFFTLTRSGFTHLVFSQLEATLRALLRAVAPGAASDGTAQFKSVYDSLLQTHLKRQQGWNDEINMIDFFRAIRNLVHNNGVYRSKDGTDLTISYRGSTYIFRHGKNAAFLPMPLVFNVVRDIIFGLEQIVNHPALVNQTAVIEDPALKTERQQTPR